MDLLFPWGWFCLFRWVVGHLRVLLFFCHRLPPTRIGGRVGSSRPAPRRPVMVTVQVRALCLLRAGQCLLPKAAVGRISDRGRVRSRGVNALSLGDSRYTFWNKLPLLADTGKPMTHHATLRERRTTTFTQSGCPSANSACLQLTEHRVSALSAESDARSTGGQTAGSTGAQG